MKIFFGENGFDGHYWEVETFMIDQDNNLIDGGGTRVTSCIGTHRHRANRCKLVPPDSKRMEMFQTQTESRILYDRGTMTIYELVGSAPPIRLKPFAVEERGNEWRMPDD